jgi:hypothetical protein
VFVKAQARRFSRNSLAGRWLSGKSFFTLKVYSCDLTAKERKARKDKRPDQPHLKALEDLDFFGAPFLSPPDPVWVLIL